MSDNYVCTWTYTPADFFEAPFEFAGQGFTVTVNNGVAEAMVEPAIFESGAGARMGRRKPQPKKGASEAEPKADVSGGKFRADIRSALEHRARPRRWASLREFSLLGVSWKGPPIDGVRKHYAEVTLQGTGTTSTEVGTPGVYHLGADGQPSLDLAQHHRQQRLGARLALHGHDATVEAMVRGLDASLSDGADVLIRLFEVRDALTQKFGTKSTVPCQALGIQHEEWKWFGDLCNVPSTTKSRHLGKSTGPLKETSAEDIDKARRMSVAMLERYLDHLEGLARVERSLLDVDELQERPPQRRPIRSHLGHHSKHWEYFILLEQDLERASRFVEFTERNMSTFSAEFAHVLMSASAEAEVMMKKLCHFFEPNKTPRDIKDCRDILLGADKNKEVRRLQDFWSVRVDLPRFGTVLQPWKGWYTLEKKLPWWDAYNAVKHERDRQFHQASLRNALDAVAALFLLILEFENWDKTDPKEVRKILGSLPTTATRMSPEARLFHLGFDYQDRTRDNP
jgi:hypothetical protein